MKYKCKLKVELKDYEFYHPKLTITLKYKEKGRFVLYNHIVLERSTNTKEIMNILKIYNELPDGEFIGVMKEKIREDIITNKNEKKEEDIRKAMIKEVSKLESRKVFEVEI